VCLLSVFLATIALSPALAVSGGYRLLAVTATAEAILFLARRKDSGVPGSPPSEPSRYRALRRLTWTAVPFLGGVMLAWLPAGLSRTGAFGVGIAFAGLALQALLVSHASPGFIRALVPHLLTRNGADQLEAPGELGWIALLPRPARRLASLLIWLAILLLVSGFAIAMPVGAADMTGRWEVPVFAFVADGFFVLALVLFRARILSL
jgi:hypothetical protein